MTDISRSDARPAKAEENMLAVEGLSIQIAGEGGMTDAVRALDLAVRYGQTFALVGESGCGKSVTALALLRLLPEAAHIAAGRIRLGDLDLNSLSEGAMREVRGKRIGIIFQEPATSMDPVMTVRNQLYETLRMHTSWRGAQLAQRAIWWLERVGIQDAAKRLDDYPFQFSGGQKQRIMIAIALAAEPQLLIADEPTTALDVTVQAQILQLLADIQKEMGLAILLITHDLAVVKNVADYVALMRAGEIVETVDAPTFFSAPRHAYARELLASIPTFAKRGKPLSASTVAPSVAQDEPSRGRPIIAATHVGPVLSVHDLTVSYTRKKRLFQASAGPLDIVRGVSFDLQAGETLALLGESGCGKTTTAKAILRLLEKQATVHGRAEINGIDMLKARGATLKNLRQQVQIVFQDPYASLDPRMLVGDILDEGIAALRAGRKRTQRQNQIRSLLDRVGLPRNTMDRYPHEFSGGQRQRIAIARALAVDPTILICDEPTSALDVSVQAQILDLLQALQAEFGIAYLFITHNFGVVEYLADRIAIMHEGAIVEMGSAESVLSRPDHVETRRLLAAVPRL